MPNDQSTRDTSHHTKRDVDAIRAACTRFVQGHYPQTPREEMAALLDFMPADLKEDIYGTGAVIETFEANVAALLGQPAAVFMPSGTMAQQIALRIWAERASLKDRLGGNNSFACHPTCHLEIHEDWAYRTLHGLHAELVGSPHHTITLDDLKSVKAPFGTLLFELPQREIGGMLPEWDDLNAITAWARARGIKLHMDGARLWECQPFYGRDCAAIGSLFDTVYVSFYKLLAGFAGAVLAGPQDIIDEARVWQHRHGGRLVHLYPYVLAAEKGLATYLDKVGAYHAKAVAIAAALSPLDGITIKPNPPHTNMMHLFLRGDADRLAEAALDIAEERGVWLLRAPRFIETQIPTHQKVEFVVGDATLDLPTDEIAALFAELLERANR